MHDWFLLEAYSAVFGTFLVVLWLCTWRTKNTSPRNRASVFLLTVFGVVASTQILMMQQTAMFQLVGIVGMIVSEVGMAMVLLHELSIRRHAPAEVDAAVATGA
jgi:hypothetical protein